MADRTSELRDEARQLLPEFSPALHAKVMAAVRAEVAPSPQVQSHWWRYALAAAAVVVVATGAWMLTRPAVVVPKGPEKPMTKEFRIESPLPEVKLALASDKGNPAYAYLDHDVAQFGKYLAKQLNGLPSNP